jgi:NADH:ubiquinone oxidoreductase subunit 4 (subunit M)
MNGRETLMLASLAVIVIVLGIYPAPVLNLMNASLNQLAGLLAHAGTGAMLGVN